MSALEARAAALLAANTRTAEHAGRRFRYSLPSVEAYPFQWFWDSCFHAIVWSRSDPERAADELRGLLAWQEAAGLIPHVVFWNRRRVRVFSWHYLESRGRARWLALTGRPRATAGIQPPVIAQAVERIVAAGGNGFLEESLPALERYYRFLAQTRDPDGDGLISIVSPFEGGLDHCPAYDELLGVRSAHPLALFLRARLPQVANKLLAFDHERILRRFDHHVEDVLVNAVYGEGLGALARLADRAGRPELGTWARAQAARVTEALLDRCFDERSGLFFNAGGRSERRGTVKTVHCLMPLILPDLPREIATGLVEHLTDPREFWAPFPVPTVALDEPTFTRDNRVWGVRFITRGPTTLNVNWFLVRGLRRHGFGDVADTLAERTRALVQRAGFNEFYDPLSGRPVGAPEFGWATLAVDL